jgi:phage shock protein A
MITVGETIASLVAAMAAIMGWLSLREKRITRQQADVAKVEMAAQAELAKVREEYAARIVRLEERIAKLEEHIGTLENYTQQYRRILDEERVMYGKLKERCEGLETACLIFQKRLSNAGLGSLSEFPTSHKE